MHSFYRLIEKLASYDKPILNEEKSSEFVQSLLEWGDPFAIVSGPNNLLFVQIVASLKAEN